MSRTTIDFGIDLGTTNSAIAELKGVSTEIIKNNSDGDITPSAVSMDKSGTVQVGQRARNRLIESPDDAYTEFKRRMGTDHLYAFKNSGQQRSPEQLSAEVLKSLRADVQQRTGETIDAAVITVPAAFELHQCDATRRAAVLAGFRECPLLQEPVAAALAYGFQVSDQKGYWLVYDFGGGTFDAAIIKADEGAIHVVNHGGDNFLGGSDIDWAIVEELLVPRLLEQHLLEDFRRGNPHWRQAFAKLKRAAEMAKIDLSRSERTVLETCRFPGPDGDDIEFEGELTREQLIRVARPIIQRSIEICQRVLKEKHLESSSIEKIILVGGPTLAPYFRQLLTEGLRIPLDHSADPLTVVARGAAIFAGNQRLARPASDADSTPGEFAVDLKYQPVGMDEAPDVGGRVSGAEGKALTGFTIEFSNSKTQWRSGRIPLRTEGVFLTSLHAEKGSRNTFRIELFDTTGQQHPIKPDELHYTIGAVVQDQPLIHSMGIALANNQYERYFEKGVGLPLRGTRSFRTMQPLSKGQDGALLRIPLIEGDQTLADRNRRIGDLEILAQNIRRDLPTNSDIEVTISMSSDRIIRIMAYVPLLDETFEGKIDMARHTPDANALANDFQIEMKRIRETIESSKKSESAEAEKAAAQLEASPLLEEVRTLLKSTSGDPDAAAKCERRLLELKLRMDEVAGHLEWPTLVSQARKTVNDVTKLATQQGSSMHRDRARELSDEVDEIIRDRRVDRIERKLEQLMKLFHEIASAQPEYWVHFFSMIEKDRHKLVDPSRAAALLEQGRNAIARNNTVMLQTIVQQLWALMPNEEMQSAQRGYQSGLLR